MQCMQSADGTGRAARAAGGMHAWSEAMAAAQAAAAVDEAVAVIGGEKSWRLPVSLSADGLEPLPESMNRGEEDAKHEARIN